jgi:hypothetical protein
VADALCVGRSVVVIVAHACKYSSGNTPQRSGTVNVLWCKLSFYSICFPAKSDIFSLCPIFVVPEHAWMVCTVRAIHTQHCPAESRPLWRIAVKETDAVANIQCALQCSHHQRSESSSPERRGERIGCRLVGFGSQKQATTGCVTSIQACFKLQLSVPCCIACHQ